MSMSREILRSKIHRAWVTETTLDYVGSIAIDEALMELVDIWPHEKLDFTHFKRHKRGNLQYDGTEWRGVSVHRSWRSIVKNPPAPTTSGYAQR